MTVFCVIVTILAILTIPRTRRFVPSRTVPEPQFRALLGRGRG